MNCTECGGPTEYDYYTCKAACAQEIYYGGNLLDTKGLISCNCCEQCRLACYESFMDMLDEEE